MVTTDLREMKTEIIYTKNPFCTWKFMLTMMLFLKPFGSSRVEVPLGIGTPVQLENLYWFPGISISAPKLFKKP